MNLDDIQTGDLGFGSGTGLVSEAIEDLTGGELSHVWVFVREPDGTLTIFQQMEGAGYQETPAEAEIASYPAGRAFHGRAPDCVRSNPGAVLQLRDRYRHTPGWKDYEYLDLGEIAANDDLGADFSLDNDTGGGVCSIVAARVFRAAGVPIEAKPSPNDMARYCVAIEKIE